MEMVVGKGCRADSFKRLAELVLVIFLSFLRAVFLNPFPICGTLPCCSTIWRHPLQHPVNRHQDQKLAAPLDLFQDTPVEIHCLRNSQNNPSIRPPHTNSLSFYSPSLSFLSSHLSFTFFLNKTYITNKVPVIFN